jgi:predicted amidophosphoribosyltransferase
MVRILKTKTCPHCRAALAAPTPRVCPVCGGSLQQRFFTAGCLSSAPPVLALALGAWALLAAVRARAAQLDDAPRAAKVARAAELRAKPSEHVAMDARRP